MYIFSPNWNVGQELILGSASPRRRLLLERTGIPFRVVPSTFIESAPAIGIDPLAYALDTANGKAMEVAGRLPEALVLGADTIVVLDAEILGKPADRDEARTMLQRLSGRTHQVITGLSVIGQSRRISLSQATVSDVSFRNLHTADIDAYIETDSPMDKAGAYGIQDGARPFVRNVRGCIFNVIGLPLMDLWKMWTMIGE